MGLFENEQNILEIESLKKGKREIGNSENEEVGKMENKKLNSLNQL